MRYRKIKADSLFDGQTIREGHTLVITEDGLVEGIVADDDAATDAEQLQGLLCPGFINVHGHLELAHMKGRIPEKTGLVDFVYKVITERHDEKEVVLQAVANAEQEMMRNGIVAAGDICNNPMSLFQKIKKNIYYHNFIEVSGYVPAVVPERFKRSTDLYNVYAEFYATPSASNSLAPHAPYSVAFELLQRITSFPGNRILTLHNQETEDENHLFRNKTGDFLRLYEKMKIDHSFFTPTGTTSLQAFIPHFYSQQTLILVHNVCTTAQDLDFIARHRGPDLYFCLCPNANLYITGLLPPVDLFIQTQQKIVLGTDSLASNNKLSILYEMNTLKQHFPHLPYEQMLAWATINGAKALGIDNKFGSFEKGKRPGVLLIDPSYKNAQRIA
ncbi:MAG TPA: amidohydrolase family protein [Chitinophagaceae bacterium]|nr:amidohydrolase family protein [Chitinophagaceae bacterium]